LRESTVGRRPVGRGRAWGDWGSVAAELRKGFDGVSARYPQLSDSEWLRWRFMIEARPVREIAAEIGCSRPTV
jgi:hypothetical protein